MTLTLGIRREDKNKWEQRTPITPKYIKKLHDNFAIRTIIQPSDIRAFSNIEYEQAGAIISEDISDCNAVFAVKEIPKALFQQDKTYVFFSHVIKGQDYNMPMLKEMMQKRCTLIDYEKIVDNQNRRLIFFGRYAGISGMIDTLYTLGQQLHYKNMQPNPFYHIKRTYEYKGLENLKKEIKTIGDELQQQGLPPPITPLIVGFAGYGNVSSGAQEILDLLPVKEIKPKEIPALSKETSHSFIYKVVFKEKDMVQPNNTNSSFDLQEYYHHPDRYHSIFHHYVPHLSILMNCVYWDERYPRLVTKTQLKEWTQTQTLKLKVIGDISVDINGGIESTEKVTTPDQPSYVYDAINNTISDDLSAEGIAIMAVDNLPCELPKESSHEFSSALYPFVEDILKADYSKPFEQLQLPTEIKRAVILHKGCITPSYTYLQKYIEC